MKLLKLFLFLLLPVVVLSQDFNNDGVVDRTDLQLMQTYIRTGNSLGDLNGDGRTDSRDLSFVSRIANRPSKMTMELSSPSANTISLSIDNIDYVLVDSIQVRWSDSAYPTENTGTLAGKVRSRNTTYSNSYDIGQGGLTYVTVLIRPRNLNFWMIGMRNTVNVTTSSLANSYNIATYDLGVYGQ